MRGADMEEGEICHVITCGIFLAPFTPISTMFTNIRTVTYRYQKIYSAGQGRRIERSYDKDGYVDGCVMYASEKGRKEGRKEGRNEGRKEGWEGRKGCIPASCHISMSLGSSMKDPQSMALCG